MKSTARLLKIALALILTQALFSPALRADDAYDRQMIVGKWETLFNLLGWFEFRANGTSVSQTYDNEWTIKDGKLILRNKWVGTTVVDYVLLPSTLTLKWPANPGQKEGMTITYSRAKK